MLASARSRGAARGDLLPLPAASDGRFSARDVLEAKDDAEAVALAERAQRGDAMELWQGARKVWVFEGG